MIRTKGQNMLRCSGQNVNQKLGRTKCQPQKKVRTKCQLLVGISSGWHFVLPPVKTSQTHSLLHTCFVEAGDKSVCTKRLVWIGIGFVDSAKLFCQHCVKCTKPVAPPITARASKAVRERDEKKEHSKKQLFCHLSHFSPFPLCQELNSRSPF